MSVAQPLDWATAAELGLEYEEPPQPIPEWKLWVALIVFVLVLGSAFLGSAALYFFFNAGRADFPLKEPQ